jgi:parvulin-like peptidyl-prolyl isomerase
MNHRPLLLSLALALALSPLSAAYGQSSNGIAAVVNGKVVTRLEVREAVEAQEQLIRMTVRDPNEQQARLSTLREGALYALIERQLVLSEFDKLGGSIKPEYIDDDINGIIRDNFEGNRDKFLAELAKTGLSLKKFREQRQKTMVVSVLRARQVKDLAPPTPAQVEQFYRKNADKFRDKDYIKFSTITIPKYPIGSSGASPESQRKLAEEIRGKVTSGADFANLARTYSQDSRAETGGDWGLQERASLSKEIADVAFPLKVGGVSRVMEIGANYMIIYCEAKQPGNMEPLEKVRPQIERVIQNEQGRNAINRWLSGLAGKAVIQPDSVRKSFLDWLTKQSDVD